MKFGEGKRVKRSFGAGVEGAEPGVEWSVAFGSKGRGKLMRNL